jgi:hypothetical protein
MSETAEGRKTLRAICPRTPPSLERTRKTTSGRKKRKVSMTMAGPPGPMREGISNGRPIWIRWLPVKFRWTRKDNKRTEMANRMPILLSLLPRQFQMGRREKRKTVGTISNWMPIPLGFGG